MQINGAAEVTLYYSVGGGYLAINKLGARVTGTVSFGQALANTLGAAIKTAYTTNLAPKSSNSGLVRVGVRDLRTDNQSEYRDTGAIALASGSGDALPAGVALCVTLRTAGSGKSFRGRMYLPGFDELQSTTTGTIDPACATSALAYCTAIQNAFRSSGLEWAVLTRPTDEKIITETTNHADGTTSTRTLSHETAKTGAVQDITAFESRTSLWESQRRRQNGRGPGVSILNPVARVEVGDVVVGPPAEPAASSSAPRSRDR